MAVSQIIKDIRCLKKLIKNATGLKVYEQEAIYHHDSYWSISNEYKDKNSPHITVTRGSYWTLDDGAEYKISIDTNRINNNVKNLRWVTIKENCNNSISLKKFRKRMLGENNPFYGKRLSDSHKKKMSLAKMGILNGNRSIPVIQINPHNGQKLKEYQSSAEAERNTGAKEPNIIRCCKHNRPIAGGFAWAYKTEYDMCKDTSVYVRPIKYRSLLKPICQYTKEGILVNEYNSLKEASRVTGISKNNISRSAVKQKSLAGGYMWKYKIK